MPTGRIHTILPHLKRLAARLDDQTADRELLRRFSVERDETAFAEIVHRHRPMLLRVCHRVLNNRHDAEDVCQAAFLVLARRANFLRRHDSVAGWLFTTAYRLSLKARTTAYRRSRQEARVKPQAGVDDPVAQLTVRELQNALDDELSRLPEKYRAPILLCCLEGKSRDAAACHLGWTLATVKDRLEQGRARLRARLAGRGMLLGTALTSAWLMEDVAWAYGTTVSPHAIAKSALLIVTGQAAVAGLVSARVAELVEGVFKTMLLTKIKLTAAGLSFLACAVIGINGFANPKPGPDEPAIAQQDESPKPDAKKTEASKNDAGDQRATRLALRVHADAAAIDKLPRFSYHTRYRWGYVDSMRAVDEKSIDRLQQALTAPVVDKDWYGWFQTSFSWDEKRFLKEMRTPRDGDSFDFWTRDEAWQRYGPTEKSPLQLNRTAELTKSWEHVHLFDYSYLRLTPHRFWWGQMVHARQQNMSPVPPKTATWKHLGAEKIAGEMCDMVESAQCAQRLWIGQDSGRVRRVASYRFMWNDAFREKEIDEFYDSDALQRIAGKKFNYPAEFSKWYRDDATEDQLQQITATWNEAYARHFPANFELNELVDFDDYREVSSGVWLPFREIRTHTLPSKTKGKHRYIRSELIVEVVRTDRDLAERHAQLLPKEGDRVHDGRFGVAVEYEYSDKRTDDEIRKLVDAQHEKNLKERADVKPRPNPFESMIGKPAPPLPTEGWIGGRPPDVRGKAYLIYFWLGSDAPLKSELNTLSFHAQYGLIVLGMHPAGTSAADVKKMVREQRIGYPTFLESSDDAADSNADDESLGYSGKENNKPWTIAGYPAYKFPYFLVIDAQGRVAGHGRFDELYEKFADALMPPAKTVKKKGDK